MLVQQNVEGGWTKHKLWQHDKAATGWAGNDCDQA